MIWLNSFPRSGNTYFRILLKEVYGIESSEFHIDPSLYLDPNYADSQIVKTHLLPEQLIPVDEVIPGVCIVRDGRDCMVSIAHHRKDIVEPGTDFHANLNEAILAAEGSYFGGWSNNVDAWIDRAEIIIRYEDLIANPVEQIERLRSIIDLPEPDISKIPSFQELKTGGKNVAYGKGENRSLKGEEQQLQHTKTFFRKGVAGSWKEEMHDEQHLLFWKLHGETMRRLGYRFDGSFDSPSGQMDSNLAQKMGFNPVIPDSPYSILVEANKLQENSNDGVKRYLTEILHQYKHLAKRSPNTWQIDLLIEGKIIPLNELDNLSEEKEASETSSKLTEAAHQPENYLNVIKKKRPLDEKIYEQKQALKEGAIKSIPQLKKYSVLGLVFNGIKKLAHYTILLVLSIRDLFLLIKHYLIISRNETMAILQPLIDTVRDRIYNLVERVLRKIFRLKDEWGIKKKIEGYDLIHLPLPQNYMAVSRRRNKFLVTVHDMTHEIFPEHHTKDNIRNSRRGMKFIKRRKASIINISESTAEDVLNHYKGEQKNKWYTIPEAADNEIFSRQINSAKIEELMAKYGLMRDHYVICLSTIEPRKNLLNTMKGFVLMHDRTAMKNIKMVIVGKVGWGKDSFAEVQQLCDQHPNLFQFTGFVEDDELPILLSQALFLSYISYYEGFGLPILEAYKCGTPVLYGDNSSQIEVGGDGGLAVDPDNIEEISQKMQELVEDGDLLKKLRKNSLRQGEQFSWYHTADLTLKAYEELIIS